MPKKAANGKRREGQERQPDHDCKTEVCGSTTPAILRQHPRVGRRVAALDRSDARPYAESQTTQRYAHLFDDPLRKAAETVGEVVEAGRPALAKAEP